jgi:hypothetical protein
MQFWFDGKMIKEQEVASTETETDVVIAEMKQILVDREKYGNMILDLASQVRV